GVSGTVLSAELEPHEKGEALGLFNALSSLASAIGAFLGGCAMQLGGYPAVCVAGVVVVAIAALWATPWSNARRSARAADDLGQTMTIEPAAAPQKQNPV